MIYIIRVPEGVYLEKISPDRENRRNGYLNRINLKQYHNKMKCGKKVK